ncbi:MAG: sensor histidine kinase [Thermodesulfobacteriota bacterium]
MTIRDIFAGARQLSLAEADAPSMETICFPWLIHFRWVTGASLLFLVHVAKGIFEVNFSLLIALLPVFIVIGSNAVLWRQLQKRRLLPSGSLAAIIILVDVALLTLVFWRIACVLNPFVVLYIIYVFFCALMIRPARAVLLIAFTLACYVGFFGSADPMVMDDKALAKVQEAGLLADAEQMAAFTLFAGHIREDLLSYSRVLFAVFFVALIIMGFLVVMVRLSIERQQQTINELEKIRSRTEKLAALATFAAGAAHEFSTPLSTVAVAAGEMLYHLREQGGNPELIEDCRLIRDQVSRCKEILYQMSADAGEHLGENAETFQVRELIGTVLESFVPTLNGHLVFANNVECMQLTLPMRTLVRTLRNVLKNAMDASEPGMPIFLSCNMDTSHIFFTVRDHGSGMDGETVKRALDPFFTTKEPGRGMGLGLYLAQTMVQRYGGDIFIDSQPGEGTTVTLTFARDQVHAVLAAN